TPSTPPTSLHATILSSNTCRRSNVRYDTTNKVELVDIDLKQRALNYKDHYGYHIMDPETYDIVTLQDNLIGEGRDYLVENLSIQVLYAEGKPVQIEMPASVNLKVVESAEGLRGDTASNVTKPAKLETGNSIHVHLFVK